MYQRDDRVPPAEMGSPTKPPVTVEEMMILEKMLAEASAAVELLEVRLADVMRPEIADNSTPTHEPATVPGSALGAALRSRRLEVEGIVARISNIIRRLEV